MQLVETDWWTRDYSCPISGLDGAVPRENMNLVLHMAYVITQLSK